MIVASFDKAHGRTAAVSGAYQYDTGQRLVMHGLPSPQEFAEGDDLISGAIVTVQAQFSYAGDSQSEMRLAQWDEARQAWLADVPDAYLTRHRDVHVFVYVYYGADDTGERTKTAYEATFRPISRPAPGDKVTDDQIAQWEALKEEIEISLTKVETATANAQNAAADTQAATDAANAAEADASSAAQNAATAAQTLKALGVASIRTVSLPAGSDATAALSSGVLTLGLPMGATGAKGATGDTGPSDVTFSFDTSTATLTITTT